MGLLSGDRISKIFGAAFRGLFEDGELVVIEKVRQPGGTLRDTEVRRIPVKVQLDVVTEAMRSAVGHASTDQSSIILRDGLGLDWITTDFRLKARGQTWVLNEVTTDPARSYFQSRASLVTT